MNNPVKQLEVWQRGAIGGIPALLQPVAHALLQAKEEIETIMEGFDNSLLWEQPAELASPAFHLQHISGVIDRLFTYAKGEMLNPAQMEALQQEGRPNETVNVGMLLEKLDETVAVALADLSFTDPATLTDFRAVGRAKLPSTVIGLYVHAAEHSMRHVGQLMVTVKIIKSRL